MGYGKILYRKHNKRRNKKNQDIFHYLCSWRHWVTPEAKVSLAVFKLLYG
jgi:hypothetical protein